MRVPRQGGRRALGVRPSHLWHMCYVRRMVETVGLRDLRHRASEVIREVEDGHTVTVTVNGRPAAQLVPVPGRQWRTWDEVASALTGPGDQTLLDDFRHFPDDVSDPFERDE